MCSKKKILALESRDLSRAEKEITACKAEEIHKMKIIFAPNDNQGPFLVKNEKSCNFVSFVSLASNYSFHCTSR